MGSPPPAQSGSKAAPRSSSDLDPALRARLLQEARTPWRGLRRGLWLALAASAALGLAVMTMRLAAGEGVASGDLLIQLTALLLFGGLLWFDRRGSRRGDDEGL
ncbi:photosystem II assembly family protein [Cyanobium sp. CH-040]|uniref:photosystem II assembly family protein n=1 Tax=Cyanobium sp. CH-040 TaxID=2823708 RepID=UPI0020CB8BD8|nr:photosystem II assembly family protein [Cyanobium sp. CH-040]MCP9927951.1 DUF3493 domain-containing protein [Cyanobium sp. CH-040]